MNEIQKKSLELGAFSVSLAVGNLEASRAFYQKLGFEVFGGDGKVVAMLKNGSTVIGLFQGMFERNMLTFNPGWDAACNPLPAFTDVRALQRALRAGGIEPTLAADEQAQGPGHFVVTDPDGNPILIDQHV
jgi:catechol 2,3-dioxygenase-like lactoylglutathione lyase family enzyme